ncbi:MAG: YkgJ family cysteine cluster protein [Cyclobacteriaceae bacterium]
MSIARKVRSIERLFELLDREITSFQAETNLHCVSGCGHCCTKPDIDASPLEFLPFAFHLFLTGQAEITLNRLNQESPAQCMIYVPLLNGDKNQGRCGNYVYRGLICRLFGYGAGRDKLGKLRLATCKIIKESQSKNYNSATEAIEKGLHVPIFSDYYQKLAQIDFELGNMILPINKAIQMAIEEVLHHYAYRPLPRGFKGAA